jgi:ribosomal protein S27AE
MDTKDFDRRWNELAEEVMTGMTEWRMQHPRASLRQIETALDERLARIQARMLQDLALASSAADWEQAPENERPVCPECGQPLRRESQHTRHVQTQGGQDLALERHYGTCPACGAGLFPPG